MNDKIINCTFSFDTGTIEILKQESSKLHLGKSAFLRFLIWNYHNQKSIVKGGP